MGRFAVEPAIAVKWFVPEQNSSLAARLLDGGNELLASDTLLSAAGRIVTAKTRLGELSPDEGARIFEAIRSVPIQLMPSQALVESALRIATAFDLPLEAGLGLTVAIHSECRLVTASRTFYDKLLGTPFAVHVKWVGDVK